ncbi:MAG: indolepyruvate oxidoreductase subunit beta [Lachnospiraceae bacterium]|jgi:indolepyruvate ferredoxin oxidoreductase beta subunit|nr:indolepyruvate oxidoreductase subunit beta [Lachnospiraceae bacterium]MDD7327943.1 indolepyruvate oxidoreductase subunit beta [Lachnospiraceae bacterium]MDY2760378.1 indolepyruvate oxidoreductase subunit beta [Lachnospiraceae bacterium]
MSKSIILCGVGGQGTILASKLIAAAAMKRGMHVETAETIGMAQRGGSVFSHVKIGDGINGPLIGKGQADLIIAFEPGEAVRQLPFLKKDGAVVVSRRPVEPVSAMIGIAEYNDQAQIDYLKKEVANLTVIETDEALEKIGNSKVLNVLLLGAAVRSGELGLETDDIETAIHDRLPEKLWEVNERALNYGN